MPESPRKTGKLGAVFMDLYGGTDGPNQRVKIADVFNWEIDETVLTEDCTIKGETAMRYKVTGYSAVWRAERYVQAPAVFSREILQWVSDPTPGLAAMGTAAGVDQGTQTVGANTLYGGQSLSANGAGTSPNKRPPIDFALYVLEESAAATAIGSATPTTGSAVWSGTGYITRGSLLVPRTGVMNDRLEVQIDGALSYTVA